MHNVENLGSLGRCGNLRVEAYTSPARAVSSMEFLLGCQSSSAKLRTLHTQCSLTACGISWNKCARSMKRLRLKCSDLLRALCQRVGRLPYMLSHTRPASAVLAVTAGAAPISISSDDEAGAPSAAATVGASRGSVSNLSGIVRYDADATAPTISCHGWRCCKCQCGSCAGSCCS